MKCKSCKWWEHKIKAEVGGICHRFPPFSLPSICVPGLGEGTTTVMTVSMENYWCAEYKIAKIKRKK